MSPRKRRPSMLDPAPEQPDMVVEIEYNSGLHPRDAKYEDLEKAKEYPHRFYLRPAECTAQVMWEEPDESGRLQLMGPAPYRLRSDHSKHPCYLRVKNTTPHKVRMLWIDYNGNEIAYELVEPGNTVIQQTFTTHPWLVREVTTCTELLLNGCEAFVASPAMLEQSRRAAAAAAVAAAASGANAQQHQQQNGQAGQQQQQQQVQLQPGIPVVEVEVQELPQLIWTKETHAYFPAWFKTNIQTLLLCHQKLQHAIVNEADGHDGRTHLGHIPSLLMPHIVALAAPETPQGVHFPTVARSCIKPILLPAPPSKEDDETEQGTAAAEEPEGVEDMEE
eukprot:GHUV01008212.1.p1 GENE.GHUV01008212.1~~GHUV01008212.1.p1  ORF type:complete len:334 (+),score=107.18 GHUV01008212.1:732-1733(+)